MRWRCSLSTKFQTRYNGCSSLAGRLGSRKTLKSSVYNQVYCQNHIFSLHKRSRWRHTKERKKRTETHTRTHFPIFLHVRLTNTGAAPIPGAIRGKAGRAWWDAPPIVKIHAVHALFAHCKRARTAGARYYTAVYEVMKMEGREKTQREEEEESGLNNGYI